MFRPILLTGAALSLVLMAPANAQEENDQEVLTGEAAYGGWEDDAPGVRRHITPDDRPFGIAFYPADAPEYIYIGESSQVVRFPYG